MLDPGFVGKLLGRGAGNVAAKYSSSPRVNKNTDNTKRPILATSLGEEYDVGSASNFLGIVVLIKSQA